MGKQFFMTERNAYRLWLESLADVKGMILLANRDSSIAMDLTRLRAGALVP